MKNRLNGFVKLLKLHRGEANTAYDEVAPIYDSFVKVWDDQIAAPAITYYNELLTRYIKPGALVLDAGAGTGERTLAILAHSQPDRVIALDASAGMLEVAKSKIKDARVEFKQGDVISLPFEDNTFDLVSCSWVIEIMDDPRAAVQELLRVIKPDGVVLYAFCSLPDGVMGDILKHILTMAGSGKTPLTHLLAVEQRPFHHCEHSSLKQFSGGLTTVALVSKCCPITEQALPCQADLLLTQAPATLV